MKPALKLGLASGLLIALLGGCATVPGDRDAFYRGEVYVRPSDSYYRSYNDRDYRYYDDRAYGDRYRGNPFYRPYPSTMWEHDS